VKSLADLLLGFGTLLYVHDLQNSLLAFLYSTSHVLILRAHLLNEVLVLVFLTDNGAELTLFYKIFNFSAGAFVDFLILEAETVLSLSENLFEFGQVFAGIDTFDYFALNFSYALLNSAEELVHSAF
jgi:hypothetical protein